MSEGFIAFTNLLAQGLALLFGLAGLLHLAAPPLLRAGYLRWGYARSFVHVLGGLLALVALFLAVPSLRIWGGLLGGLILFFAVGAMLGRERYTMTIPILLLLLALPLAMA